ncbi:hypothetical protein LTR16_009541, partial [Cryomyces antarcticus]
MLDLLASHADGKVSTEQHARLCQYLLPQPTSGSTVLQPKLLFAVDPETGEPLNACLSPETKTQLQQLAISRQLANVRITELSDDGEEEALDYTSEKLNND